MLEVPDTKAPMIGGETNGTPATEVYDFLSLSLVPPPEVSFYGI